MCPTSALPRAGSHVGRCADDMVAGVTCYHMSVRVAIVAFADAYSQACAQGDGDAIVSLFPSNTTTYGALRAELAQLDIASICAQLKLGKNSKRLADLAEAYLAYVGTTDNISVAPDTYDAWAVVFTRAASVFALDLPWFSPSIKYTGRTLVDLAIRSDAQYGGSKIIDAAGRVSKCAALSANDRTGAPMADTKRACALSLANASFRAYLRLRNTRLCETVLGSVQNALQMNIRFDGQGDSYTGEEGYPMSERVIFHYYVGRIRLAYGRVTVAAENLRWAFDRCPATSLHNRRVIAIPLASAYIVLGRYPTRELLAECGIMDQYAALVHFLKLGNGDGVMAELQRNTDWLRAHGVYGLLLEKLTLGVWRNIFRRCLLLQPATVPNAPPTISLQSVLVAARHAWKDPYITADDVECLAANLIDQGLVKAYILHAKGIMVLQKGVHRGFLPMASVYLH